MFPGFSGGPLIDASGCVLGLLSSHLGRGQTLAIPAADVERIANALQTHGKVRRGYLGIGAQQAQLPAALKQAHGIEQDLGLLLVSVDETGPAGQAGLTIGDIILSINGQPVQGLDDLRSTLGGETVGTSVTAHVLRGGEPRDVAISVGEQGAASYFAARPEPRRVGAPRSDRPAMVTTTSQRSGAQAVQREPLGARLSRELADLAERVRGGIVEVRNGQGGGTGTVVRPDGLIVTNHHVVPGEGAQVTTPDGRQFPARVIASLAERDLAVLKIEADDLPWLPLGDSSALRVGELLLAVGHPLGVTGAATIGVYSGVGPIEGRGGKHFQEALLAAIELRPGNSGGPLVTARGEVVGINAMVLGPHTALAVPSATVQRLIANADNGGRQTLGVQIGVAQLSEAQAARHSLEQTSALIVLGVDDSAPAGRAGLLPGDILLRYNGQQLQEPGDLAWQLTAATPGVSVTLSLLRGGEPRELIVPLGPVS